MNSRPPALAALYGMGGSIGTVVHQVPAGTLLDVADALHLATRPDGSLIRSAHGPPFLGPLGILLVYVIPAAIFTLLVKHMKNVGARRPLD